MEELGLEWGGARIQHFVVSQKLSNASIVVMGKVMIIMQLLFHIGMHWHIFFELFDLSIVKGKGKVK